jgi:hypothetical protein
MSDIITGARAAALRADWEAKEAKAIASFAVEAQEWYTEGDPWKPFPESVGSFQIIVRIHYNADLIAQAAAALRAMLRVGRASNSKASPRKLARRPKLGRGAFPPGMSLSDKLVKAAEAYANKDDALAAGLIGEAFAA